MPEGINDNGLTLTGFIFLHALFIEKGRLETTWIVLRKFGYDNDIKLSDLIPTAIKRSPDQASTAAIILLMTLITSTLHSSIPHPAYASVQPITKTGGLLTTELLSSGWAGFFAGCLHTLSGPDHLVALAPLSIGRSRLESGLVGALWGCGHDAGQVIFGLLFLLLKDRLHIEVLRTWGTRVVGLTLLIIGGMGIREASEVHESSLALAGVDCNMSSSSEPLQTPAAPRKKKVGFATFATGVVHGLHAFTRHIFVFIFIILLVYNISVDNKVDIIIFCCGLWN